MAAEYNKIPIEEKNCDSSKPIKFGYGVRHVQALIFFLCLCCSFLSSAHLGATIVAMTMVKQETNNSLAVADAGDIQFNSTININSTCTDGCIKKMTTINNIDGNTTSVDNKTTEDHWNIYKTFDWPKYIQEMILGSYFFGSFIMMFPIGLIIQRWGGKIPLQFSMLVNGVTSFLAPWLVTWGGWKILCFLRALQGASHAGMFPGTNTLLSNWAPLSERGSLSSFVYTGSNIGCVIAFQLAGILGSSRFGWPSTFWLTGVTCLIGFVLITVFGAATPKDHKSITEAEKLYIMGTADNCVETKAKVPWKAALTSVHVWATIVTHIGHTMSIMFFFMQVPTYMFAVLKVNIMNSGVLTSLPYLVSCFSSVTFGYLSDFMTNRNIISVKSARRLFNSIASFIPALCLMLVTFTTNIMFAVILFILFAATGTAVYTGFLVNYTDLSPNFTGAIMAMGNTLTNIFIVTLPLIVSNIITDVTNQHQWRVTSWLVAAITIGANIVFVVFMSAEVQPWNNDYDDDLVEKKSSHTHLKYKAENRNV